MPPLKHMVSTVDEKGKHARVVFQWVKQQMSIAAVKNTQIISQSLTLINT